MGVPDGDGVGVSELLGLGVGVALGAGVGVDDEPLKTMLGLWLLASVTVKLLVVSRIVKVSVPAFVEETVNVATPFCAWILTGGAEPLIVRLESLEVWEKVKLSDETLFLLQSFILTVSVTAEPVLAEMGDVGETTEYQKFATPEAVVQLGFPEALFEKVITGL